MTIHGVKNINFPVIDRHDQGNSLLSFTALVVTE